jgi:phosphoserine phosphatase
MQPTCLLTTITGRDRPGITAALFAAFAAHDVDIRDVQQIVIHDQLVIAVLLELRGDPSALRSSVTQTVHALGMECEVVIADEARTVKTAAAWRSHVIVMGRPVRPGAFGHIAQLIADRGDSIESVAHLSSDPVASIELIVRGNDPTQLRAVLVQAADETGVDVAVQPAGLRRRAKRLVLLDLDTTLIRDEAMDALADRAGRRDGLAGLAKQVAAGDLDPADAVRERAGLLTGLTVADVESVRGKLRPTPGARTFVRTLHRLGFRVGVVSDGFTLVTDRFVAELELDFAAANELEVVDGRMTGRLLGAAVDRAGKAAALETFAAKYAMPMAQTVAVGDGADDVDMIAAAGQGIAFNAASPARAAAKLTPDLPYLDPVLFVLGIPREELHEPF